MTYAAAHQLPAATISRLVNRAYCCGTQTLCRECQCVFFCEWWDFETERHESKCSVGALIDSVLGRQLGLF